MFRGIFLFPIFTVSTFFCLSLEDIQVETPSGGIKGEVVWHDNIQVARFLGIPYVKAPIKDLRFRRPVPIEPWDTPLIAKDMSSGCVQYSPGPYPNKDFLPGLSEDCLYLNIWAPRKRDIREKKAVMFWIHGGGFVISSSRVDYYDGLVLAAEGDVIVVTTNFRLGPEGFLYSDSEDAPGNMGLLDLVEALKWVRNNIEPFGGDKDSITLFGQSSGAITIGMFCVSPITRGLFKRAILQGGAPTNLDGEDNKKAFRASQKLAEAVGCARSKNSLRCHPAGVVECLRNVDAFTLAEALSAVTPNGSRPVYPRFGDELLPRNPRQSIVDGDFTAVDVLVGGNNGDGAPLITKPMRDVFGYFGEKDPQINLTFGESIIRKKFKDYPDPDSVVRQYLSGVPEYDYYNIRRQVFTASGDFERTCPTVYFTESFARKGVLAYYFVFVHRDPNMPWAPWMLAAHFDETPFAFGYPLRNRYKYTEEEIDLSLRMIRAWSSFAKTGFPSPGVWPFYSKRNPSFQVLDVNSFDVGFGPHRNNCDFFRSQFGF